MSMPLRLLTVVILAMLSACSTLTSDNPIGGSAGNHADARLVGVWKITKTANPGEVGYLFVSPKKDAAALHAVFVGWSPTSSSDTLEFDVVTGSTGGETFVNLDHISENGKPAPNEPPGYLPLAYEIDAKGMLVIYDESADGMKLIKAAVDARKLKGTVKVAKSGDKKTPNAITSMDIHLTSDQKTVDVYFAANAKTIFTDSVDAFEPVKVP